MADKKGIILTQSEGFNIGVEDFRNANGTLGPLGGQLTIQTINSRSTSNSPTVQTSSGGGFLAGHPIILTASKPLSGVDAWYTDSSVIIGSVSFSSAQGYSVTTSASGTLFNSQSEASTLADIGSVSVATQVLANDAISRIDGALAGIDNIRATLGALQNRFGSAISSLQSTGENVSAARSRIQDADFAAETAELSRTQILQQAGTAMLSQANASVQNVLQLLKQ
jgi:flagellin